MDSLRLTPFSLPLSRPFTSAKTTLRERKGYTVQVRTENDTTGYGEICPLPHTSNDELLPLQTTRRLLKSLDHQWQAEHSQFGAENFDCVPAEKIPDSILMGYLQARVDSLARSKHQTPLQVYSQVLGLPPQRQAQALCSARLISLASSTLEELSAFFSTTPARCVKVKLHAVDQEQKSKLLTLCEAAPERTIRIDCNMAFSAEELARFLHDIPTEKIDFLEDPTAAGSLKELSLLQSMGFRIGLDEPAVDAHGFTAAINHPAVSCVVIKPALLRSPHAVLSRIHRTLKHAKKAVISSLFESPVGFFHTCNFAQLLPDVVHGLDTQRYFAQTPELQKLRRTTFAPVLLEYN